MNTPHLDALAQDGTLFRRHFANCAPCGPSRASLLTGQYLHKHRSCINGTPLNAAFTNVALEARKLGYDPIVFGYTDTSPDPGAMAPGDPRLTSYEGFMDGFDIGLDMTGNYRPWIDWLKKQNYQIPQNPKEIYFPDRHFPIAPRFGNPYASTPFSAEDSETEFQTRAVIAWLKENGDKPWFAHISYLRPHPPFIAPHPYSAHYVDADIPAARRQVARDIEAKQHPFLAWAIDQEQFFAPADLRDLRQFRAAYYGLISHIDAQIGTLISWLKQNGQYERTIIIFTSDHGEMLGDHWLMGKLGYFDAAYHIPLIVKVPDGVAAQTVDRFTESVDILPTILDLLGSHPPEQCDGRALTEFLQGRPPEIWRDAAYWEYDFRDPETRVAEKHFGLKQNLCALAVYRGERYKYVRFHGLPALLFDLRTDPWEFENLIDRPDMKSVAEDHEILIRQKCAPSSDYSNMLAGMKLTAAGPIHPNDEWR